MLIINIIARDLSELVWTKTFLVFNLQKPLSLEDYRPLWYRSNF